MNDTAVRQFEVEKLRVHVYRSKAELGVAAAGRAESVLRDAMQAKGRARVIVGTGTSQNEVIDALVARDTIDWKRVEVFHMDEYVGIADTHPASFRRWLKTRVADVVHPGAVHYMMGDAADIERECARYTDLLREAPVDIAFVGFGENGHIAFNDPHEADFDDPQVVKIVTLDRACRGQQVGEGIFEAIDDVPPQAITLTCPALLAARTLICCVPDKRKAAAVRCALEGPVSTRCPASVVRTHPRAELFLDEASASELSQA